MTEFEDVMAGLLEEADNEEAKDEQKGSKFGGKVKAIAATLEAWVEKALNWITTQAAGLRALTVKDPARKNEITQAGKDLNAARSILNTAKGDLKRAKASDDANAINAAKEKVKEAKELMSSFKKIIAKGGAKPEADDSKDKK